MCFLLVPYFRSTWACSSSHCLVSCCQLTCSTTAKTWLKKRQPVTSAPQDRRSRHLTTLGPTVTNLRAMAWLPWKLEPPRWADNHFRTYICVLKSNTTVLGILFCFVLFFVSAGAQFITMSHISEQIRLTCAVWIISNPRLDIIIL